MIHVYINRENALNSPLYNLTHPHGMSPMGYSKSPIVTSGGGSGVSGSMTMTHANNIGGGGVNVSGMSSSYSCTNPYGLKTVDGGVNSNVGINSLNAAGGVVSVGGNNALCSSSSLSINPNVNMSGAIGGGGVGSGGGSSMGVIPGEGPPTPTQELDSSLEQQQRKCKW